MARTLEFNYQKATEMAMKLFWKEGYKKASIQSLLKAMKLGESSFYNTFKNKRNLYIECIDHYNKSVSGKRAQLLLSDKPVRARLRDFFNDIFESMAKPGAIPGCLMANSLTYEVMKDKHLKKIILGGMSDFRCLLINTLDEAIENNAISAELNSELIADIIIIYLQGIFKMAVVVEDTAVLRAQTDYFLEGLGL